MHRQIVPFSREETHIRNKIGGTVETDGKLCYSKIVRNVLILQERIKLFYVIKSYYME